MSSMLEQAILDAKDLKEAAIKNAQQAIIEKYSDEFEGEIEKLLEQATPPADPMATAPMPIAPAMPGMPTAAGAAPVDPEKAKNDSDNKSDLFDKLNYAFADGEVIGGKAHTTGVVEIDLDSLTKFSFQDNQKSAEQMALQELKALSKKTLNEELDEEMNDDDDYDDDSETFPYGDDDSDDDELDMDDDDDTESDDDDLDTDDDMEDDMDDEDLEDDDMDDMDDLDLDVDIDDEDGTEVDIDDEDLEDDDMEDIDIDMDDDDLDTDMDNESDDDSDEDLYDDDDETDFEIDFETDPDDADYNPDADVDTDMDDDEEDEMEELEEGEKSISVEEILQKIEALEVSMKKKDIKDASVNARLQDIIKAVKRLSPSEKKELKEAIKLDYKRTGPRSKWTGMFHEEAEHDVTLANLQVQIEELEQEVDTLQESNKKFKAGLKDSIKLIEKTAAENKSYVAKINQYEEKLHESRLLNYKLLYTNKALSDASLNERQKNKLAESINGAKTAEEVKLLYETLKSTMRDGTSNSSSPKSLSEAVERRSSSLLLKASRAEAPKQNDYAERMKKLAGLT